MKIVIKNKFSKVILFLFKLFNWHMFLFQPKENIVLISGLRTYACDHGTGRTTYSIETTATQYIFSSIWKSIKRAWPKKIVPNRGPHGMAPFSQYKQKYWLLNKDV